MKFQKYQFYDYKNHYFGTLKNIIFINSYFGVNYGGETKCKENFYY